VTEPYASFVLAELPPEKASQVSLWRWTWHPSGTDLQGGARRIDVQL